MGPVAGHLGTRVSALLDGRLDAHETERAWNHVHGCHACRDLVEREGWVKHRLARLSAGHQAAPDRLKGSLLGCAPGAPGPDRARVRPGHGDGAYRSASGPGLLRVSRPRRALGLASLGGGAVGCAVVGVLALGAATPASAPAPDRRLPASHLAPALPSTASGFTPASVRARLGR